MGKVPGVATIQTRTTIGTSMRHWSRAHRTMCLIGKVPGVATIQTRTTIGTSMGHWSRAHRTMCPDGEGSWCGYNTDQDNYRHKYGTLE